MGRVHRPAQLVRRNLLLPVDRPDELVEVTPDPRQLLGRLAEGGCLVRKVVRAVGDGFAEQEAEDAARGLVQGLGEIPQRGRFGWTDAEAQGFRAGVGAGSFGRNATSAT